MAGHYYYDPRPFYGHSGSNGLMPLDELFYGRYEPVPYWMDQRMTPVSAYDDYLYQGPKQMAMGRAPPPQLQQYAYKRPESRDDIYTDMYKRSLYNYNGVAPPQGYGGRPQSQDDTYLHAVTPHGGYGPPTIPNFGNNMGAVPMGSTPSNFNTRGMDLMPNNMTTKGNNMNVGSNGNYINNNHNNNNKQISGPNNQVGNQFGNQFGNQVGNKSSGFGSGNNGYSGYGNAKSSSQGGKSMNSKGSKTSQQQRYVEDDSTSDDSDDEWSNNRVKWGSSGGSSKHGNGGQNFSTQMTGSKGISSSGHGYDTYSNSQSMSSKSKSGGHGGVLHGGVLKSGGSSHGGGSQSKISKMLRFQDADDSTSDSDDERYGHTKSKTSKLSSSKMSSHGNIHSSSHGNIHSSSHGNNHSSSHGNNHSSSHGNIHSSSHGNIHSSSHGNSHGGGSSFQNQSKNMSYGSSLSKGVELKVPICCDNCERKVRECLQYMDGVENVLCDQWNRKVIVYGNVKPDNVLKRVRKVKKGSELWQQGKLQQQQMLRVY